MNKQALITRSFQKYLKKCKHRFTEKDVLDNLREFIRLGLRKWESILKTLRFGNISIVIVKLRIRVNQNVGRYIVGVINEQEYLPIFIDSKTGVYGKNLSFESDKKVVVMLETAFQHVLTDYLEHTEEHPTLQRYEIE